MPSGHSSTTATSLACAACKYQRRKCTPDCLLAPYFPHHRHSQFLNAHKLFGVSNITKIIKPLTPPQKHAAMHSIIFQSDARANDPVGGCYRIMRELQYQIEYARNELDLVLQHLAVHREHGRQESHVQIQEPEGISSNLNHPMPYHYPLHLDDDHKPILSISTSHFGGFASAFTTTEASVVVKSKETPPNPRNIY